MVPTANATSKQFRANRVMTGAILVLPEPLRRKE